MKERAHESDESRRAADAKVEAMRAKITAMESQTVDSREKASRSTGLFKIPLKCLLVTLTLKMPSRDVAPKMREKTLGEKPTEKVPPKSRFCLRIAPHV